MRRARGPLLIAAAAAAAGQSANYCQKEDGCTECVATNPYPGNPSGACMWCLHGNHGARKWSCESVTYLSGCAECVMQPNPSFDCQGTMQQKCPKPPTPAPGSPERYHCTAEQGTCTPQSSGHSTMAKCQEACGSPAPAPIPTPPPVPPTPHPGPTPTPQPAPTQEGYLCTSGYECVAVPPDTPGATPKAACAATCVTPTPAPAAPPTPPPPPSPTPKPGPVVQMATYHLVPAEYTGLANKNTGNVKGDIEYALSTLHTCTNGTNHRCMDQQVVETVQVSVYGNYSDYKQCNVDPANGRYVCCDGTGKAGEPPCSATASCLVGRELKKKFAHDSPGDGYWYSWPQCGEGSSWVVTQPPRRISASCVGNGWRKLAGSCPSCGPALDECVSWCIGNSTNITIALLENVWHNIVEDNEDACPSVPPPPHTPSPRRVGAM